MIANVSTNTVCAQAGIAVFRLQVRHADIAQLDCTPQYVSTKVAEQHLVIY